MSKFQTRRCASGIGGIPITLSNTTGFSQQTATDADGLYTFNGVPAGVYTITEGAVPSAYINGKDAIGSLGGFQPVTPNFSQRRNQRRSIRPQLQLR